MGAFTSQKSQIIDTITDIIAIKTGIILNSEELCEIISKDDQETADRLFNRRGFMRFRSEEFEALVTDIRFRMGDLKDTRPPAIIAINLMIPWENKGYDTVKWQQKMLKMMTGQGKGPGEMVDSKPIFEYLLFDEKLPPKLISDLFQTFIVNQERSNYAFLEAALINGTPLNNLFSKEIQDSDNDKYIAQKFINYLAANPEQIDQVHWRNFERFCAEYFDKMGFIVELGTGGNDGGIDIVIRDPSQQENKPLIIVQCKRYKGTNDVSIETVKAFSTDVTHAGAVKGIIATTSRIAPGGKTATFERNFPLEFVEADGIKNWIRSLHKPK
jgi:restriction system protein